MTKMKEPVNTTISTKYFRELQRLAEIGRQHDKPKEPPNYHEVDYCEMCSRLDDEDNSINCSKYPEYTISYGGVCDDFERED